VLTNSSCNWISGVLFNIPEKWNCEEIINKNATYHKVDTRTHVKIPAIKCSNITRTVCTKAFLRISLSMITNKEIQYSYGWLGVNCQSTSNFILTQAVILQYDGRGYKGLTQKGECITNTSIIIWNSKGTANHFLYRKIGRFKSKKYNKHFIIDELQASLIINENYHILNTKNYRFTSPFLMQGDIVIEVDVEDDANFTRKFKRRVIN
ncbi:unnamed protein product, partial [Brugia timori]|uniref:Envelope glycoprotein n=1 Tax=Brugia timori TaxID=42155 RepID=A0A0R3QC16_9BILA